MGGISTVNFVAAPYLEHHFTNYSVSNYGSVECELLSNIRAILAVIFALATSIAVLHSLIYLSIQPESLSAALPIGSLSENR
jgi:hypothetical protein